MSGECTAVDEPAIDESAIDGAAGDGGLPLHQRWYGWGSPVGLGLGLVGVAAFFVLVALGLSILDSIGPY